MRKRKRNDVYENQKRKNIIVEENLVRCEWVTNNPLYIAYHDNEWGQPQYNSLSLFEMLCLEGQQAGLSWITILKKRQNYKLLFHNFNPHDISKLNKNDIDRYLIDPGVIRHRGKLEAIVHNSKCYIKMEDEGIDFSKFVWSFVDGVPIVNRWNNAKEVPTQTEASKALSNALKKRCFKFVGSTICYAFMQACGVLEMLKLEFHWYTHDQQRRPLTPLLSIVTASPKFSYNDYQFKQDYISTHIHKNVKYSEYR